MLSRVHSVGVRGVEGYPVLVELDLANGLPAYATVGLPDSAVRESRERVASAVRNSGFQFPPRKVTVNLAPAQSRKEGTQFDLPIALAFLTASGQLPQGDWPGRYCFVGELALDGALRPVPGVLPMAEQAKAAGFDAIIVPSDNADEARATGMPTFPASTLREVAAFIASPSVVEETAFATDVFEPIHDVDLSDVRGQLKAKRGLEIAAAGGHNLVMIGPPGSGKSMLAKRLITILPPLSRAEALEVTRVHSVGRRGAPGLVARRPFRSPHHTSSTVSLIGGGPSGRPGEVSLAHGGVLFLDELGEFGRAALEALRQPLEDGKAVVARARDVVEYPARFQLVAASNPCPCGYRGHPKRECLCTPPAVAKYVGKLSGPLLDRVDLQVAVQPVPFEDWAREGRGGEETSADVLARVEAARRVQAERWGGSVFSLNAFAPSSELRSRCGLDGESLGILESAAGNLALSARSLDRALKVARTIADLAGARDVGSAHVLEALSFRGLDLSAAKGETI